MKNFIQFISEMQRHGGLSTPHNDEHDEVHYQLQAHEDGHIDLHPHLVNQLKHLSSKENFQNALSNAKREKYTRRKFQNVDNTDAGFSWERTKQGLDPNKVKRAEKQKGSSTQKMPIILRHKETGHEHLLAGNTRASIRGHTDAQVIEY